MVSMRLLTPHQVQLTQAMHLFLTTQGTAAMEGTALGDDNQTPHARPTQAIWINATTSTDITVDHDPEWIAIHYTPDCAEDDPTLTGLQTRWAVEANRLDEVALDDILTPQTMEPAGRTARTHRDPTKHTLWHYSTTIHPEAVTRIKEALSLTLPDTHNAHQLGMFTIYWSFPTDTGMVPKVAEPPLPPTVTALAKAAQGMAHREGAPQDWTPNVLVEQRAHHNANKAQQAGRQIHPLLHDKDGNLQPHSPWMVHFILEDNGDKRKRTEVQITHALAHTHLNYTVPTSNALVTYGEARKSTYRLQADTEGTAYTVYTWARYGDLPTPIWHPDLSWHQPLHRRRVPRQSIKPAGNTATGTHNNRPPPNIINSALANARMLLIDGGCPAPDDTIHCRTWGTIRWTLHHNIDRDQATWIDQGSVTIRLGGWLNTLNPKKLRGVAGPYILYPVPRGMDGSCRGLRPGDPRCGHPCPHAMLQPLPPQPASLPGIYLNTVTGAKGVYLTAGDTTGEAIPLNQVHHMALGPRLPNTDKPRHPLARHSARDPRPVDPNAPGPDRALLHLTMKRTAQLPTTLVGEKYFIVEGLTEDVITLAANTLAATSDAWDVAVGHPTARKDRVQGTEDTLTPDLMNHLVTLTSPLEQNDRKTEGPKVTDWAAFNDRPPDTPTVTLTCHQHTWWVAQRSHRNNRQGPHIHTGSKAGDPTGTGRPLHPLHPPHQPPQGALIGPQNGDALDSRCPSHGHHAAPDVAYTHAQPGGLCAKARDSTGAALDVLAHGHGANSQTPHRQPTRTRKSASGYAQPAGGTGTGVQHIPPRRTEAGPQTGARTAPAQTEALPRGGGRLGPPGQAAQTGA